LFPIDFINLNDDNLDNTSSFIVSTSSTTQTNVSEDNQSSSNTNNEIREAEQKKDLSRWDDAWNEYEQQQQQINEIPPKGKTISYI